MKKSYLMQANGFCLLVEDQNDAASYFRQRLENAYPHLEICLARSVREAKSWLDARQRETPKQPLPLALVDLGLPDGSGIEIIETLKQLEPETMTVVLTIHGEDSKVFDALGAGAFGYLLKDENPDSLELMLKRIERNEPPLSPSIARRLLNHFQKPAPVENEANLLTPRERQTLALLARGLTVPETAANMGLSRQTVASYVKVIYQKIHVTNRAQATSKAIRLGLI